MYLVFTNKFYNKNVKKNYTKSLLNRVMLYKGVNRFWLVGESIGRKQTTIEYNIHLIEVALNLFKYIYL